MGLCLEVDGEPLILANDSEKNSRVTKHTSRCASTSGCLPLRASPLVLPYVLALPGTMNNSVYASEDHSALWRQGAMRCSRRLIKLKLTRPMTASKITVTNNLGLSQVSEESRKR